jgi:hypothetical protein
MAGFGVVENSGDNVSDAASVVSVCPFVDSRSSGHPERR